MSDERRIRLGDGLAHGVNARRRQLSRQMTEALAVAQAMERGQRKRERGLQVIQVKKTERTVRIIDEAHVDGRAWKPKLRRK